MCLLPPPIRKAIGDAISIHDMNCFEHQARKSKTKTKDTCFRWKHEVNKRVFSLHMHFCILDQVFLLFFLVAFDAPVLKYPHKKDNMFSFPLSKGHEHLPVAHEILVSPYIVI